jgi:acetyltransferase-like isoleucine patch superfamily enzyme
MGNYHIPGVKTFEYTKIVGMEHIEFGHDVIIDDFVFIYATNTITIGNYVHIASFTSITGGGVLRIADFANISSGVRIATGSDDFKDWGFGGPPMPEKYRNVVRGRIQIGKFCVIGANSVILPNVAIGEGVSIGAASVVTRDLEPWGIYIGNKRVGERNKAAILKNYEQFLLETDTSRGQV